MSAAKKQIRQAPVDPSVLRAIWQDLLTTYGAIDAAVPEDANVTRVHIDAALGTLTRAMVALEDVWVAADEAGAKAVPS